MLGSEGNERSEHYCFPELELPEKDKADFQRRCGWKPVSATGWTGCEDLGIFSKLVEAGEQPQRQGKPWDLRDWNLVG